MLCCCFTQQGEELIMKYCEILPVNYFDQIPRWYDIIVSLVWFKLEPLHCFVRQKSWQKANLVDLHITSITNRQYQQQLISFQENIGSFKQTMVWLADVVLYFLKRLMKRQHRYSVLTKTTFRSRCFYIYVDGG